MNEGASERGEGRKIDKKKWRGLGKQRERVRKERERGREQQTSHTRLSANTVSGAEC